MFLNNIVLSFIFVVIGISTIRYLKNFNKNEDFWVVNYIKLCFSVVFWFIGAILILYINPKWDIKSVVTFLIERIRD